MQTTESLIWILNNLDTQKGALIHKQPSWKQQGNNTLAGYHSGWQMVLRFSLCWRFLLLCHYCSLISLPQDCLDRQLEEPLKMQLMVLKALAGFTQTTIYISIVLPQQNHLPEWYLDWPARMIFAAAFLASMFIMIKDCLSGWDTLDSPVVVSA